MEADRLEAVNDAEVDVVEEDVVGIAYRRGSNS